MSKTKMTEQANPVITPSKPVTETPRPVTHTSKNKSFQGLPFLFDKQNYILMGVGLAVIIIGYMMMSGGRSMDPNIFDADGLYSFRRITLAPVLILIGLVIEGYAIMKKPSGS